MIALIHGALGATCGILLRRRAPTVTAALISHLAVDAINHDEPTDGCGSLRLDVLALDGLLLGLALLALSRRYGVFSPQTVGAVAACMPDLEHLLRRLCPCGRSGRHEPFPHARWPSQKLNVRSQFIISALGWIALLRLRPCRLAGARAVVPLHGADETVTTSWGAKPAVPSFEE